jgi:RNA polymerase sigma factor (sigma-70 family)
MDTSASLLGRLAGAPTDDDWWRLDDLYRPLLRAWVARAGVPASDVEDLVQDVLFVVSREIARFEWRGQGAFRGWLRTILANRVRDHFRGQKYRPTATGVSDFQSWLDELGSHDSALSRLLDREHDEHVVASLMERVQGDFAPATCQAFLWHLQEGEPAKQVTQTIGLSLNSVLWTTPKVVKGTGGKGGRSRKEVVKGTRRENGQHAQAVAGAQPAKNLSRYATAVSPRGVREGGKPHGRCLWALVGPGDGVRGAGHGSRRRAAW